MAFFYALAGLSKCRKMGGKSPVFSPAGGANEVAHILSLTGGAAAVQG